MKFKDIIYRVFDVVIIAIVYLNEFHYYYFPYDLDAIMDWCEYDVISISGLDDVNGLYFELEN